MAKPKKSKTTEPGAVGRAPLEKQRDELAQRYKQGREQLAQLQRALAQIEGAIGVLNQALAQKPATDAPQG